MFYRMTIIINSYFFSIIKLDRWIFYFVITNKYFFKMKTCWNDGLYYIYHDVLVRYLIDSWRGKLKNNQY